MACGIVATSESTGALDNDLGSEISPGQVLGIRLGEVRNLEVPNPELGIESLDVPGKFPVDGVVP